MPHRVSEAQRRTVRSSCLVGVEALVNEDEECSGRGAFKCWILNMSKCVVYASARSASRGESAERANVLGGTKRGTREGSA